MGSTPGNWVKKTVTPGYFVKTVEYLPKEPAATVNSYSIRKEFLQLEKEPLLLGLKVV